MCLKLLQTAQPHGSLTVVGKVVTASNVLMYVCRSVFGGREGCGSTAHLPLMWGLIVHRRDVHNLKWLVQFRHLKYFIVKNTVVVLLSFVYLFSMVLSPHFLCREKCLHIFLIWRDLLSHRRWRQPGHRYAIKQVVLSSEFVGDVFFLFIPFSFDSFSDCSVLLISFVGLLLSCFLIPLLPTASPVFT